MEEITLTDAQRATLIDRVRTYSAAERDRLGEVDEAVVQWDELSDIVAQEGPLPLDPVTVYKLHEVFDNEAWDPVPDVRKRMDQTPEHMMDVVRAVSSAWHDPEMWDAASVPAPPRTDPDVLQARVTSMFDDLEQNHRPGGAWRRLDPAEVDQAGKVDLSQDTWTIKPSSSEAEKFYWEVESPAPSTAEWSGTVSYDEMIQLLSAAIDRDTTMRRLDDAKLMPLGAELVPRIAGSFPDAGWSQGEDSTFAQTLEYPEDSRIRVWESTDFMSVVEGYTWDIETYDAEDDSWAVTEQREDPAPLSELRERITQFHSEGQERFDRSTQGLRRSVTAAPTTDAAVLRLLEHAEKQDARIAKLEKTLEKTSAELQQTRDALLSVGKKLLPSSAARRNQEPRPERDMDTGPIAEPTTTNGQELHR